MITKSDHERQFAFNYRFQYLQHSGICRSRINNIAGKNHQIRAFIIKHLIYAFQSDIRSPVAVFKMHIGKLHNFEFTIFTKFQFTLLSHTKSCYQQKDKC